jgi:hypothetical protein
MTEERQTVVVLGASPKPERYSNKAVRMLVEAGHKVIPVHPAIDTIEGLQSAKSLEDIKEKVDTLTLYVSEKISTDLAGQILALNPQRVIFNPGTENPDLKKKLEEKHIKTELACSLVLLRTGQF